jgi:catechol 2,3-dioxygenase-like lactoylglutathione lyase family enzyme
MDWKLELVVVPVADVDRAKSFYSEKLGFHVDVDYSPNDDFRVVQLTPPGSACSISVGKGISGGMEPGCIKGLHLIVADIEAARAELLGRGVAVSESVHFVDGKQQSGPDPQRSDYNSFMFLNDPDGNAWMIQEVGRGALHT